MPSPSSPAGEGASWPPHRLTLENWHCSAPNPPAALSLPRRASRKNRTPQGRLVQRYAISLSLNLSYDKTMQCRRSLHIFRLERFSTDNLADFQHFSVGTRFAPTSLVNIGHSSKGLTGQ